MKMRYFTPGAFLLVAVALMMPAESARAAEPKIDFSRDIRPLLSDTCYKCHGPDEKKRQAELRFDTREGAFSEGESGELAIVPGKSDQSALYMRLVSDDESLRMPPADSDKQLTPAQIALIKTWIDQGAKWQDHWSFIKPQRPALPKLKKESPGLTPVDRFVRARLEEEGLQAVAEADKITLVRRVTFDLTGLPPTPEEVAAFVANKSPNAYEKLVDRLLKSPHYGEHMARFWLDAARYGDTHGLHLDNERSIWPYRNWVIDALNKNMSFDQFTVEQIAGDLLPKPTLQQRVATGFNRCNVTTSEGGSIAEEYRVRYAVDRVETIATVFLGLTLNCTVCHEHKFDPISQQEFYQLFAYYANTADAPMDKNALLPPPSVKVATPEQEKQLAALRAKLSPIQKQIAAELAKVKYVDPQKETEVADPKPQEYVWIEDDLPKSAVAAGNTPWQWVTQEKHPVFSGQRASTRTATGLSQHYFTGAKKPLTISAGDKLFTYVFLDPKNPPKEVMLQWNDGAWEHRAYWGDDVIDWGAKGTPARVAMGKLPELGKWVRLEVDAAKVGLKVGAKVNGWAFTQFDGTVYWDKAGIVTKNLPNGGSFDSQLAWEKSVKGNKSLPKPIQDILKVALVKRNDAQKKQLQKHFIEHVYAKTRGTFAPLHKQQTTLQSQITQLDKQIPNTLVMAEKTSGRVDTYLLQRGQYDQPDKKQKLNPGVPSVLHNLPKGAPTNRLGLAQWLVSRENPLTARVTVNRFWQQYFGMAIVKTTEDFGSQGQWPSHPKLLDWLAVEFIESGWNIKHMQKLIVMSQTYRQTATAPRNLYTRDPENRLLARGPRFRLDAEMVRDNALAVSGLMVNKIGGPSVKPYQPSGLWKAVGYSGSNTVSFKKDSGEALFRRSMYTFWKRTSPPPSMTTFDAPSRESCVVTRARTNTPLQALTLLNDIQFVEAARHLGQRMMKEGGTTPQQRIARGMLLCTSRQPDAAETAVILQLYQSQLARFQKDPEAAKKLLSVGDSKYDESMNAAELAAWTMVANTLLNLDETITKG